MPSKYINKSDYNSPKFKLVDNTPEEYSKDPTVRYVALLQYRDQERRAVIMRTLPESKNHLKYLLLEMIEKEGLPEDTQLGEVFKVDESAIDTIQDWVDWKIGINEVYKVAIDGLVNRKTSFRHVYTDEVYKKP
jgi:hypothetical protein